MFFVVFLPTKRGLSLICYSSDCLLSTTNQRFFFIRVVYTTTYQRLFTKKGSRYPPRYYKKLKKIIKFFPLRIEDLRYVLRKILLQSILHWDQIRSGKASELAFREEYERLLLFSLLTPWKPAHWLDQAQILYRNFGWTASSKLNYSQHIFLFQHWR